MTTRGGAAFGPAEIAASAMNGPCGEARRRASCDGRGGLSRCGQRPARDRRHRQTKFVAPARIFVASVRIFVASVRIFVASVRIFVASVRSFVASVRSFDASVSITVSARRKAAYSCGSLGLAHALALSLLAWLIVPAQHSAAGAAMALVDGNGSGDGNGSVAASLPGENKRQ
ncbi:hypothetical protein EMIHUDRAFT_248610 [Emiliania huxleyi CCMP1516]|uniref:Uncharacterized protein n=2 Tax=Emiliania huxleyi TaxID=2903 RepID=A0A0D3IF65_EMIH1|nr:hypothetical protein EMIHUDRAFT_248610 [Emiliania huxleyi CCMP1516]EOD09900.1 hypothetical protein EMIHUDRAFT_248610 [Emiliania huxleyi CCMP1516]|eukprot:XP_005762329.1 hypothetical protein EMIHUDRAFT_248610 [Emiliania huxleyi CCMP1516]